MKKDKKKIYEKWTFWRKYKAHADLIFENQANSWILSILKRENCHRFLRFSFDSATRAFFYSNAFDSTILAELLCT